MGATPSNTASDTPTPTPTPSNTATPPATGTPEPTQTQTPSLTQTGTPNITPSVTPSVTPNPFSYFVLGNNTTDDVSMFSENNVQDIFYFNGIGTGGLPAIPPMRIWLDGQAHVQIDFEGARTGQPFGYSLEGWNNSYPQFFGTFTPGNVYFSTGVTPTPTKTPTQTPTPTGIPGTTATPTPTGTLPSVSPTPSNSAPAASPTPTASTTLPAATPTPTNSAYNIWNESINGPLSNSAGSPTVVTLNNGNGLVIASVAGNSDYFTFLVGNDQTLNKIFLRSYSSSDNVAWLGIQSGSTWTAGDNPGSMLAQQHFGPGNINQEVLSVAAPYNSGNYTLRVQQLGSNTNYTLEFQVLSATAPTPTPTASTTLPPATPTPTATTPQVTPSSTSSSSFTYSLTGPENTNPGQKVEINSPNPYNYSDIVYFNEGGSSIEFSTMSVFVSGQFRSFINFTNDRLGTSFGYRRASNPGSGSEFTGIFVNGNVNF